MKIGITGSQGFIGKHLVNVLKSKKNIELFYCDLPKCDLLNPNSLKKFVSDKDVIIHAAAVNRGSNTAVIAGSVVATYNLISAMKNFKSKAKLIYLSSVQAETDTVYGLSKKLAELTLQDFSKENKTPISVFRLTNVFGEMGKPFYNSVVSTFCHQVANNQELTVKNGGKKFKFIYVVDVMKIIVNEVFKRRKNLFYLKKISSNNKISVSELAKIIKSFKNLKNSRSLKSKFQKDLYRTYLSYKI